LSWQLANPAYVLDLRQSSSREPRSENRLARRGRPGPDRPQLCVLLVSRAADQEAAELQVLLRKVGVPCVRLDAEAVSTADLVIDLAGRAVRLHDHWIRPAVTWVRHFSARALADHRGPVRQAFLRDSWQALVSQLAAISVAAVRSDGPGLLAQLALAAAHGIKIPRTVIAADPAQAAAVLPAGRQMLKALHQHFIEASPGLLTGVFPELVDSRTLAATSEPPAPPIIVQQYVDHDLELRVYYVLGEILTFQVSKNSPADPWIHPSQLAVRQAEPPPRVVAAVERLASAMSLEYGAFDFLVADDTPTFLEVNLAGDWCWIEKRIRRKPVTMAVARMLRDLYFTAAAGGNSASGPIELTTFLSGPMQESVDS
jgi:hypothetical protein